MTLRSLLRAWIILLALSAASTAFAEVAIPRGLSPAMQAAGAALLTLVTLAKARTILSDYLRLAEAPAWRQGFTLVLSAYLLLLLGLYLGPLTR